MGGLIGGFSDEAFAEQERRARDRQHENMMTILNSFDKTEKEILDTGDNRVKIMEKLSPEGKLYLESKISEQISRWCCAPMEQAWAKEAQKSLSAGDYQRGLIYRYISSKDILEARRM